MRRIVTAVAATVTAVVLLQAQSAQVDTAPWATVTSQGHPRSPQSAIDRAAL